MERVAAPATGRVLGTGAGVAVAAAVTNNLIALGAKALGVPEGFRQYSPLTIVAFTLIGCFVGTGAFLVFFRGPGATLHRWRVAGYTALVLSFGPDLGLLTHGADRLGVVGLMLMHVVAGVPLIEGLAWTVRRRRPGPVA